jgi:hypothetical protein
MRATRRPAGRDLDLMIRVHQRLVTASDGFRYPLTIRFVFLDLLLAWQRRMPHAPDDGFVWCDLIRVLGETDLAWAMAHATRAAAEKAGNQLDLADAILMVGNLHVTAGEMEQERRLLEEAMARLQQVGQIERAKKIGHQLGTLPKPTTPRSCVA